MVAEVAPLDAAPGPELDQPGGTAGRAALPAVAEAGLVQVEDGNGQVAAGSSQLASATAGAAPSVLPWIIGIALAGLIAIGFWVGHRVNHRRQLALAA